MDAITQKLADALRKIRDRNAASYGHDYTEIRADDWETACQALAEYDAQERQRETQSTLHAACDFTLSCTYEEFNRATAEFCKASPTCNREQLENGRKALALMYLGMETMHVFEAQLAIGRLEFGLRRYMERDFELTQRGE